MIASAKTLGKKERFVQGYVKAIEQDGGYKSTSIMASQTALSLLETRKETEGNAGGVFSPAIVGEVLEKKLNHFGIKFELENNLSATASLHGGNAENFADKPSSSCFLHY